MAILLRYAASVIGAALAAGVAGSLLWPSRSSVLHGFIVALAHAAILGLPAALVLLRLRRDGVITALSAGFVIGAGPFGFGSVVQQLAETPGGAVAAAQSARVWYDILTKTVLYGACGALGGIAAWVIWRASARAPALLFGVVSAAIAATYALVVAPLPFVQQWWRAQDDHWDAPLRIRNRMADGLLLSGGLIGKTRSDIVQLLGEPPPTGYFRDWDMVYNLGAERHFFAIDSEWLVIRLDDKGVATEARLTVD